MDNESTNGIGPVHSENDDECTIIEKQGTGDRTADHVVNVEYLRAPVKQHSDKREYRPIRLPNGLTALLISDPDGASSGVDETQATNGTHNSANAHNPNDKDKADATSLNFKRIKTDEKLVQCVLNIGVGSSSDPPEIAGLARFMENVVLESRFGKSSQDFGEFVSNSGGWCYAYTSCNKTAFNFAIPEKFLRKALDHFARLFASSSGIKQNGVVRARQSLNGRQFFRNDLKDEDLHPAVLYFKEEHYRAHNVTVAIEANLPLEILEKHITDCFLSVPKKPLSKNRFCELKGVDLLDISRLQRLYRVDSDDETGKIEFVWTVPSLYQFCRSKPLEYVSWTICNKGKGSLIGYLRRLGWCLDISSSTSISHSNCCLFTIALILKNGSKEYEGIGRAVYSYINLMRNEGPKKRIYDDIRKIKETKFRFLDGNQRVELTDLCDNIRFDSCANYVTGTDDCFEWDPVMITACMNELSPEHVNIVIFDKADEDEPPKVEPRFQTKYTETGIAKNLINEWKRVQPLPQFKLPKANVYVADDFTLLPTPENSGPHPVKIHACAQFEIWYKPYSNSQLPTCRMNLHYISPIPLRSPENAAMLDLLVITLKQLLLEELYPATAAALHYHLRTTDIGLNVILDGLNQKIPLLSQVITKSITDCSNLVTKNLFDALKSRQLNAYCRTYGRSGKLTKELELSITRLVHWSVVDKHAALDGVTYSEFLHFVDRYCDRIYVQCFVEGNMSEAEAIESVNKCVEILGCGSLLPNTMPQLRTIEIPRGVHCCRVKGLRSNELPAVRNCYLFDDRSIESIAMINMLHAMMGATFEDFRNRISMKWMDIGLLKNNHSVIGYSILEDTRSSETLEEIDEGIEDCRTAFGAAVAGLSDRDLTSVKNVLAKKRIDDDWNEITSREYAFDRRAAQAETINRMTIEEIKRGLVYLTSNGPACRKLSIQVVQNVAYEEESTVSTKSDDRLNDQQFFTNNGNVDLRYRYLTDLPNETTKGDDYYIVNIEDYKRRSIRVLEGPKSTAEINGDDYYIVNIEDYKRLQATQAPRSERTQINSSD